MIVLYDLFTALLVKQAGFTARATQLKVLKNDRLVSGAVTFSFVLIVGLNH